MVHGCLPARHTSGFKKVCCAKNASLRQQSFSALKESKMDEKKRQWCCFFTYVTKKKANTAVTDVVEQLLTVIIKHDKTSGWTCQSSMDKDHPLTPAICAASQTRLCVCFHIPLPPTKHHWAVQSLLPRNDCKSGSERVFNKSTNLFINNYVVTKVIRNCLNSWCDTVAQ